MTHTPSLPNGFSTDFSEAPKGELIYLSGPMSGYPDFNYPLFNKVASELRAAGNVVYNPAEYQYEGEFPVRAAFAEYSEFICLSATMIALLPGWEKSLGVSAELALAKNCRIKILELPIPTPGDDILNELARRAK